MTLLLCGAWNIRGTDGILSMLGKKDQPHPPLNLLGDFCGGGLLCAMGIVMALFERSKSGKGQVVDLSMSRGSSYLSSWVYLGLNSFWTYPRGGNLLDGGYHSYGTYETKDGKWMAVGALEYKFFNKLLEGLQLTPEEREKVIFLSLDETGKEIIAKKFKEHTRDYWTEVFSQFDACVTPVLTPKEAACYDHNVAQNSLVAVNKSGEIQPTPEPRLSRTPATTSVPMKPVAKIGTDTEEICRLIGYTDEEIKKLLSANTISVAKL